jgi:hypothetical protein
MQGMNEPFRVDMPLARLSLLAQRCYAARGQVAQSSRFLGVLHRDMFSLCWGPLVRAVAALLDAAHPDDSATIRDSMAALRAVRSTCEARALAALRAQRVTPSDVRRQRTRQSSATRKAWWTRC